MRARKEKSPQYNKLDKTNYELIPMTTKDSGSWKYKRLEDREDDDSSDSAVADEHKKMLS